MVRQYRHVALTITLLSLSTWMACGPERDTGANPRFLLDQVTELNLEVAYETGAAPYAGTYQGMRTWKITEDNVDAIYATRGRNVHLYVPDELALMTEIPRQPQTTWSQTELRGLEKKYRSARSAGEEGRIFLLFVNGYYRDPDTQQAATHVMAVTLSNSTVVVVFKPVIQGGGLYSELSLRWTEQSTVVHELGHVIGLVDNGVPHLHTADSGVSASAASDAAATGHCANPNCVMYWAHEGFSSLINMTSRARTSGSLLLFGQECLQDLERFK